MSGTPKRERARPTEPIRDGSAIAPRATNHEIEIGDVPKDEGEMRMDRNSDDGRTNSEETTESRTLTSRAVHTRADFGPNRVARTHATVFFNRIARSVTVERCEGCSCFASLAGTESDRIVK